MLARASPSRLWNERGGVARAEWSILIASILAVFASFARKLIRLDAKVTFVGPASLPQT
jgi:hypothetical protein